MDITTMLVLIVSGHLMVALMTYGYIAKKMNYILKLSIIAQMLFVCAYSALLGRTFIANQVTILLANSLLIAAMAVQTATILYAVDRWSTVLRAKLVISLSIMMSLFYGYVLIENNETIRIVIITTITAGLAMTQAYYLLTSKPSSLYRKLLGSAMLVVLAAFAMRIYNALLLEGGLTFLSSAFSNIMAFFALYLMMVLNGIGLLLLIKEKDDEELRITATVDSLTKLYNRGQVTDLAVQQLKSHERHQRELVMMVVDIDHFKAINDQYGHPKGDEVLKDVARIIGSQLRPYDLIGRFGGDEFVIVLPETSKEEAHLTAERLRKAVQVFFEATLKTTISLGFYACVPDESTEFSNLFALADEALYRSKASGGNCVKE